MKFNLLLMTAFLSVIIYASVQHSDGIVGTTLLNGNGCVCHDINPTSSVSVWIEGPSELNQGETGSYTLYLTGGPMVTGGFNVAARFNTLGVNDTNTQIMQGELTHTAPLPFVGDTVSWTFTLTADSSEAWDTLYSVANSVNGNGIPDIGDEWNFGANFPVHILPPTPVELTSFTVNENENNIILYWSTATETNNKGFEIEKRVGSRHLAGSKWEKIGFVQGSGTTTEPKSYSFVDNLALNHAYTLHYHLKQIDFNGSYKYSKEVEVETNNFESLQFSLNQNFPNPFNPATVISWQSPKGGFQTLKVYDVLGREVATLVNEYKPAGKYEVRFDGSKFPSGIYFYTLQILNSNNSIISETIKKMILMK